MGNPILCQDQLSSPSLTKVMIPNKSPENGSNPPQQLPVPLLHSIPDPPNILPALETRPVEERLLDAVGVVCGPALGDVGEVESVRGRLVGAHKRGDLNMLEASSL